MCPEACPSVTRSLSERSLAPHRSHLCCRWSVRVLSLALAIFGMTLGCDDEEPPPTEIEGSGPRLLTSLVEGQDRGIQYRGELSFPLPNDAIFKGLSARFASGSERGSRGSFEVREDLMWGGHLGAWGEHLALLGGFPLTPLISVPISAPVDLGDFLLRHQNRDPLDDAIYLLCVSPSCAGEVAPLAAPMRPLAFGLFAELDAVAQAQEQPTPQLISRLSAPLPPRLTDEAMSYNKDAQTPTSLVWSRGQQVSGSFTMTPSPSLGEDAVTLYLEPQRALRPGVSYAVIVTRALRGESGPVRGPQGSPYLPEQRDLASQISPHLESLGITTDDISFAWRFTTGDRTKLYQSLRGALGIEETSGAFGERTAQLKPQLSSVHSWATSQSVESCEQRGGLSCRVDFGQVALLREGALGLAIAWAELKQELSVAERTALAESYQAVRGLFSGELSGWTVGAWRGAPSGESLPVRDRRWPFWCVIPESGQWIDQSLNERERAAPFPVLLWMSTRGDERLNHLLWAGHFARAGYASCSIESAPAEWSAEREERFMLSLSVAWRDLPWDPSLAMSVLTSGEVTDDSQARDVFERPLNRALTAQQLIGWLGQTYPTSTSSDPELGNLRQLLALTEMESEDDNAGSDSSDIKGVVYGGEGDGASAAALSAGLDDGARGLITVDLQANVLQSLTSGHGALGAEELSRHVFGPWLVWRQADEMAEGSAAGWTWQTIDGRGRAVSYRDRGASEGRRGEDAENATLTSDRWSPAGISLSAIDRQWVALHNERSGESSPRKQVIDGEVPPLTVASLEGDPLSLHIFSNSYVERPQVISDEWIIAPHTGWGADLTTERARLAWRIAQWEGALHDPLEAHALLRHAQRQPLDETRTLTIAHPRAANALLSGSLRFTEELGVDESPSARAMLYDQPPHRFFLLSQAYEPRRSWGDPWLDWDDLDALASAEPPFTRNTQILLSRPTERGGYHALRLPWRADDHTGLRLPERREVASGEGDLSQVTLNMIGAFLIGLDRTASAEELSAPCLHWAPPHIRACPMFTLTARESQESQD